MSLSYDVVVVGGGSAGLCAAVGAKRAGAQDVLVIDRESKQGGILKQCIHNGFGLHRFGEELTGPEYAARDVAAARELGIEVQANTTVLSLTPDLTLEVVGPETGVATVKAGAIVLATGSRERTRGAIKIAGTRPVGVYTAGTAQRLMNINGVLVGKRIVILGSGDIGLIMARRMTYEGARVLCVCELAPEPGGLRRNIVQCLDDYGIPLHLSTTVTQIHGAARLEGVTLSAVDPKTFAPLPGTERFVACDTLLLSVGLIPENELAKDVGIRLDPRTGGPVVDHNLMTSLPGVFACGNELHVHDLVDFVSEEGELAGRAAAQWAARARDAEKPAPHPDAQLRCQVTPAERVGSITPHVIYDPATLCEPVALRLRSNARVTNASLEVSCNGRVIKRVRSTIVVPSEMQTIVLKPADLARIDGDVEVSIKPLGE